MASIEADFAGVLWKKSEKGLKKDWKQRYFELSFDHLYYYKNKGDDLPINYILLQDAELVLVMSDDEPAAPGSVGPGRGSGLPPQSFPFHLLMSGGRTYRLRAETAADRAKWVDLLEAGIDEHHVMAPRDEQPKNAAGEEDDTRVSKALNKVSTIGVRMASRPRSRRQSC